MTTRFVQENTVCPVKARFNIDPETCSILTHMTPEFGFNGLGEVVFKRTYSRGGEDWKDVVIRVINGVMSIRKDHFLKNSLRWVDDEWQEHARDMAISMFKMEWLPPGRGLWMMGTEFCYNRGSMSSYNCAASDTTDDIVLSAEWTMDCLMNGVGVGFNTSWRGTATIPTKSDSWEYIIQDSREGWVGSLIALMCSYVNSPRYGTCKYPIFNYSLIRGPGEPIRGFGGTASGYEPLKKLHDRVESFLDYFCQGVIVVDGESKVYNHTRLIADIFNAIGACVVAGNVRRSAEICLGGVDDRTFLDLKSYETNPERGEIGWMSNNSVVLKANEDFEDFDSIPDLAKRIINNGEPGMINLHNIQKFGRFGKPMKDEATLVNPCFRGDTLIATGDGRGSVPISQLANEGKDVPVYSIDPVTHEVSLKWGRNPRVTGHDQKLLRIHFSYPHKGQYLDVTPNHRFLLNDGREVEAQDLVVTDSLPNFKKTKFGDDYLRVYNPFTGKYTVEHRMIAEFHDTNKFRENYDENVWNGCCKTRGVVVHHKDEDKHNNSPDNLEITTAGDHSRLHNVEFIGSGNPMYGRKHRESTKKLISENVKTRCLDPEYRKMLSESQTPEHRQLASERMTVMKASWDKERYDEIEKTTDLNIIRYDQGTKLRVVKVCENEQCGSEFHTEWGSRERAYCSISCGNTKQESIEARRQGQRKTHAGRSKEVFHQQAMIYKDLEETCDPVMKKEWETECKSRGVSHRFQRDSPNQWIAKGWREFKIMVDDHNHRVARIEELPGQHTVYNITIDENHTLAAVTGVKDDGVSLSGVYCFQCGEINLESKETCNLAEVFPTRCAGPDEFTTALQHATFYSSTVSLQPTHRPETNAIVAKNRRIGVSISGVAQWASMANHPSWGDMNYTKMTAYLRHGYKLVRKTNSKLADSAGVPHSIRVTTIKPSGSISLLAGCTPGVHYPVSRYAIRRMRIGKDSPLVPDLIRANIPYEDDTYSDNTYVFEFMIDHGDVRPCDEVSPWEQFSIVAMLQRCWSDNAVSATVYFDKEKDASDVEKLLAMYIPVLKSVSMLPLCNHGYAQAPYEPVDRETYLKRRDLYTIPDFSNVTDNVPVGSKYCSGDRCDV
jgi:ribonucleotide reductase alpha subunit